jgi:hypothetical protein
MAIDIEYFFVMQFIYAHQILTHANLVFGLKTQNQLTLIYTIFKSKIIQVTNNSKQNQIIKCLN